MDIGALMSLEVDILSDVTLKSISEWQDAIDREGFPLRLTDDRAFSELRGFSPAILEQKEAGFECYQITFNELVESTHGVRFDREWKYVLELVYRGDVNEMFAALMAATAYARATGGVVLEAESGRLLTPSEACAVIDESKRALALLESGDKQ